MQWGNRPVSRYRCIVYKS